VAWSQAKFLRQSRKINSSKEKDGAADTPALKTNTNQKTPLQ
jgi:hypothetical protein